MSRQEQQDSIEEAARLMDRARQLLDQVRGDLESPEVPA